MDKLERENSMKSIFFAAIVLAAIALVGCSKKSSSPVDTAPTSLTVNPSDGQAGIRLDAGVTLTFAKPVDRVTVESNFHLISQRAMPDSLCPDSTMMPHGGMTEIMNDSAMIRHMGQVHSTRGRFTWNGDNTMLTFRPDSMMTPRTQYMIHVGSAIMQMMQRRMGDIGEMGNHGLPAGRQGSGVMQDHMMLHFTTLDTTGTGSGHEGHH